MAFCLLLSSSVWGTTPTAFTWNGGAGNTNWGNSANWTNGAAPASSADNIIIMGGFTQLDNNTAARTIHSLYFSNNSGAFTIGGGTITIANVAGINQNSTNAQTITNAITLSADQTWTIHSNSLIHSTGILDLGTRTLTINNNTNVFLRGVIAGSSSTDSITKNSNGFLHLSGANTYSADVAINDGVFLISTATGLGDVNGTSAVGSGGTLGFSNNFTYTTAELLTISGVGENSLGAIHNFHGDNYFNAAHTLGADSLVRLDAGSINFGNTFDLGGFQLTVSNSASTIVQMTNVLSSTSGKIRLMEGSLFLSRSNIFTGAITNESGMLFVSGTHALGTVAGKTVINSGATLAFSNNVNYAAREEIRIIGGGVSGDGAIGNIHGNNVFAGSVVLDGGAKIKVKSGTLILQNGVTNGGFLLDAAVDTGNSLYFSNMVSGTGGLLNSGAGSTYLNASNSFTGNVTNQAGNLRVGHGAGLGTGAKTVVLSGGSLIFDTGVTNTSMAIRMDGGEITLNNKTSSLGTLTLVQNSTLTLNYDGTAADFRFDNGSHVGGTLTIVGWNGGGTGGGNDRVFFTNDPGSTFLSNITFTGFSAGAQRLGTGEIIPSLIPEPGTYLGGGILLVLMALRRFRGERGKSDTS